MSIHSSQILSVQTPQSCMERRFFGSQSVTNRPHQRNTEEKLFCSATPYSSISKTLKEHIAVLSNGEVVDDCGRDSGFSTAVSSLMHSQNDQMSPSPNQSFTRSQHAKSYEPSPAMHLLNSSHSENQDQCSESRYSLSSQYQFGEKTRSERNLQLYHQEAFKFLLSLNTNKQKLIEAENQRKLRKQLNLDLPQQQQQLTVKQSSELERIDLSNNKNNISFQTNQSFQSTMSAAPQYLRKSRATEEKKNTVQTILASSFCKSSIFLRNNKTKIAKTLLK